MIVSKIIVHQKQEKKWTCASASIAMLLNRTQQECEAICQTKKSGTSTANVSGGLTLLRVPHYQIAIDVDFLDYAENLSAISKKFPIFVSGEYKDKNLAGRGRDYRKCG